MQAGMVLRLYHRLSCTGRVWRGTQTLSPTFRVRVGLESSTHEGTVETASTEEYLALLQASDSAATPLTNHGPRGTGRIPISATYQGNLHAATAPATERIASLEEQLA